MGRTLRGWAAGHGAENAGPAELGATLDRLRTALREATDFMVPWAQFHDEVAMAPAFTAASQPGQNARLDIALEAAGSKVLGRRHPISDPVFLHLEAHHFWHGACQIGPRTAIFFYFADADTGLTGIFRDLTAGKLDLVRFSLVELPAGSMPSRGGGQA